MSGPRANETTAFYTVRTQETKWQVQTEGIQKKEEGAHCGESD